MAESGGRYCPLCGTAAGLVDRFCASCGYNLSVPPVREGRIETESADVPPPPPPPAPRDAPETSTEGEHGTETPASDTDEPRRSRSWWRRFFGFE